MLENVICAYASEASKAVETAVKDDNGLLTNLLHDGYFSFGLFFLLLALLAVIFGIKASRRFVINHLKYIALVIFLLGVILYGIGYNEENSGSEWNFIALGFRSVLSSLEMFISHSDLIEVDKIWHHCPIYMAAFSLIHFLAVLVSAIFVVQLLGFRLISWIRMIFLWIQTFNRKKLNLYIFWGFNDISFTLAKDIVNVEKQKKEKWTKEKTDKTENYKIIFVALPSEESGSHQRFTFSHFFSGTSHGKSKLDKCEDLNALVIYSKKNLSIDDVPAEETSKKWNLFKKVGLKVLGRLLERVHTTKIFFLSDNEDDNIKSTLIMRLAASKGDASLQNKPINIYCHARRDNQNVILENMALDGNETSNITVHIIDSSYLSVLSLKMNPVYHPVNFVKKDTTRGIVQSPFTALIIGFGETGQDALKFLYEFGAFVGEDGNKSPFKCYAIDQHMDALRGDFYMKAPALVGNDEVELIQGSNQMPQFWDELHKIINQLNYVVIAIGDDQKSISFAINLYEFACRYRENNLEHFKIFVRSSYNSEKNIQLRDIANYYNQSNRESLGEIIIFGSTKEVFTYDMVVNDRVKRDAMGFLNVYEGKPLGDIDSVEYSTLWTDRHNVNATVEKYRSKNNPKAKPTIRHFVIQDIKRQEFQDMANVYHVATKLKLVGMFDATVEELNRICESFTGKKVTSTDVEYPNGSEQLNDMMKNLAKCEHLRWNTSHEMMGYTRNEDITSAYIIAQKHHCLVAWDEMDRLNLGSYKEYDYLVVETSFKLRKDTLSKL
ncbi:hypothetical protein [Bacteroides sp.]|uniref:hypothetical protein n=1 Tax=Bacteroides sp. TaxID=29523 RepID=UPI002603F42A|nr:hypothetical protein [Bacteroides sp.]MDD3040102.1 hypothetical protein [Bacteroides sp.]